MLKLTLSDLASEMQMECYLLREGIRRHEFRRSCIKEKKTMRLKTWKKEQVHNEKDWRHENAIKFYLSIPTQKNEIYQCILVTTWMRSN